MKSLISLLLCLTFFSANALSLKVGLLPNEPPYSIQVGKNNVFSGFEVQLMTEICKRLHAECTFVPLQFQEFFPAVADKQIDLAIGQISITLARAGQFLFSIPYMIGDAQFIVKNDSTIKQITDVQGKKVGIYKASLYKDYVVETFNNQTEVVEYNSEFGAFQGLLNDEVNTLLLAKISERYWIANNELDMSVFRFIGQPIPLDNGYGILANLQSTELIHNINQVLLAIQADGTYLRIYNLYFSLLPT